MTAKKKTKHVTDDISFSCEHQVVVNRYLITDRVRSTTGRLCFDTCLSICPQQGGGVPRPGPGPEGGGYPGKVQMGGGGTLPRSRLGGEVPWPGPMGLPQPGPMGGYPSQVQMRVVP